jgi:hypothetical protein
MARTAVVVGLVTIAGTCLARRSAAADEPGASGAKPKFTLRYKFNQGERLYWEVGHRARIRSTVGGSTQTVETSSDSLKVWRVESVNGKGEITLVHQVDRVQMRHRTSGREETVVEIPSPDGKSPPLGYEQMADDVGVPLTRLTMDASGKVIRREDLRKQKRPTVTAHDAPMTIPLPTKPLAIGEKWSSENVVTAPRKQGGQKVVKLEQRFTLHDVRRDVATIALETLVLTPINEPEVQAHVVQSKMKGTIRFDLVTGRVVEQDLSLDEEVIGYPQTEASSMHYVMKFVEKYLPEPPKAAAAAPGSAAR